SGSVVSRP
ncbi:exonuclease, partial [Escherichia coli CB7326]